MKSATQKRAILRTVFLLVMTSLLLLNAGSTAVPTVSAAPLLASTDDFVITVKTDNPGTSTNTQFMRNITKAIFLR